MLMGINALFTFLLEAYELLDNIDRFWHEQAFCCLMCVIKAHRTHGILFCFHPRSGHIDMTLVSYPDMQGRSAGLGKSLFISKSKSMLLGTLTEIIPCFTHSLLCNKVNSLFYTEQ